MLHGVTKSITDTVNHDFHMSHVHDIIVAQLSKFYRYSSRFSPSSSAEFSPCLYILAELKSSSISCLICSVHQNLHSNVLVAAMIMTYLL